MGRVVGPVLLFAAFAMASPSLVHGSDAKGSYAIRGIGSQECQTVLQELQKDKNGSITIVSWMLGYMTAVNRYEPTTFDISPVTDVRALANILLALCQKTPKARLETVLSDMLRAMARARVQAESPLLETKSGNTSAVVRQEVLLAVQQRLGQLGLLKARPDGNYGAQTEAALKEYQKAEKLPVTGVADAATVLRLLVEQAPQQAPAAGPAPPASPAPARAPAQPAPARR